MAWRRNHRRLRFSKQKRNIGKFMSDVVFGNGRWSKALVDSGWRPKKNVLDNFDAWHLRSGFEQDKAIAAWKYLYEISLGDAGSNPVIQDSQVLGVAQNQGASRSFWFGEHQHSSARTQMVGW